MEPRTRLPLGRAAAALFCAAVLAVACDSPTGSDNQPGTAAHLDLVSGDLQTAEVGVELPQPLVVKVTDAKGKPVSGQIINFRVVSGGGSVFAGAAQTNAGGVAQERWTLGTTARDTQRVEARAVDPATGQALVFGTFRAVGRAGAPAGISPVGSAARSGSAGAALGDALQARVTDKYGNAVPAAAVVWTVRSGGGSVTPGTSTADSLGIAAAMWTLGPRVDSAQVVEAAATVAIKTAFTATAALPLGSAVVKRAGDGQTGTAGTKLAVPLKVAVLLPGGQPAVGATVSWSMGAGAGTITPLVGVTDANGEATAEWTLGTMAGTRNAFASVAGAGTVTFGATAAPGAPAALQKLTGDAQTGSEGSTLPAALVVRVVDAQGNAVPGAPLAWTVTAGGGSLPGAPAATGADGTGSASWTLGTAGTQTVHVASGALAPVDFTATATRGSQGRQTLVASVAGRILDLDATRVLYLDSTTAAFRRVRLRTLATGAEAVVDSAFAGRLTPSGALLIRGSTPTAELLEYRDGTVSSLGPNGYGGYGDAVVVSGNWAAWMTSPVGTVMRRDLAAGTNVVVATPATGASRATLEVGSNGDVVYEYYIGGGSGGTSIIKLFHDGATIDVYGSSSVGVARPKTDGGNVVFTTLSLFTGYEQWLWHGGATERLAQSIQLVPPMLINLESRVAGGWVAYLGVSQPNTPSQYSQVRLRTPGGADEGVSTAQVGFAARPDALCPDGSLVYSEGGYIPGGGAVYTRRYIAYRGGPLVDLGPPTGTEVVCRGGRFFLLSGGAGYELSQ